MLFPCGKLSSSWETEQLASALTLSSLGTNWGI